MYTHGIRNHDHSFRESEDNPCLKPRCRCDWQISQTCMNLFNESARNLGVAELMSLPSSLVFFLLELLDLVETVCSLHVEAVRM
jgi:hypothetical protein